MAPTQKQCYAMVDYFIKRYKEKYIEPPRVNRFKARYGFQAMLTDMPDTEVKELIDYYLMTESKNRHALDWLFNRYEKILDSKEEYTKARELREKTFNETVERTKRWRELRGK